MVAVKEHDNTSCAKREDGARRAIRCIECGGKAVLESAKPSYDVVLRRYKCDECGAKFATVEDVADDMPEVDNRFDGFSIWSDMRLVNSMRHAGVTCTPLMLSRIKQKVREAAVNGRVSDVAISRIVALEMFEFDETEAMLFAMEHACVCDYEEMRELFDAASDAKTQRFAAMESAD